MLHRDSLSFISEMESDSVDCVITDPPYDLEHFPLAELVRISRGNIIAFCKPENQWPTEQASEFLFWVKTPSTKNYLRKCGRFVEMIIVYRQGEIFNQLHWSQMTGVYDDRHIVKTSHPYQKPLTLMERLVRIYSNTGDTVFDPFMGSGTTGVACKNLSRHFLGIEQEKEYFDLATARIE